MRSKKYIKTRRILAYILPPVLSFTPLSLMMLVCKWVFGFGSSTVGYFLELSMFIVYPISLLMLAFYITPDNKKKVIKVLSILYSIALFTLFADFFYGYLYFYQAAIYVVSFVCCLMIYIILRRKDNKNEQQAR